MKITPFARTLALALGLVVIASACGGMGTTPTATTKTPAYIGKTYVLATGPDGGTYGPYGAAVAKLLTEKLGATFTVRPSAGGSENAQLLRDRKADITITTADIAYEAASGAGRFASPELPFPEIRALGALYAQHAHIVVRADSAFKTVTDLKGKRVSTYLANSGTEGKAVRILKAYGIDPDKDITRSKLGNPDAIKAMAAGTIDAFFYDGGFPADVIVQFAKTTPIRLLNQDDVLKKLNDTYGPYYFATQIPKTVYGTAEDATVISVTNLLVVRSDFDPALGVAIVRTLLENVAVIAAASPEGKNLNSSTIGAGSPIKYLPSVQAYYESKGMLH